MRLDPAGREFWEPEMSELPVGYVAVQAKFLTTWVNLVTVDGKKVVLVSGPSVLEAIPVGYTPVTLPLGRTHAKVKLIGPDSVEVIIRPAGVVDVED